MQPGFDVIPMEVDVDTGEEYKETGEDDVDTGESDYEYEAEDDD